MKFNIPIIIQKLEMNLFFLSSENFLWTDAIHTWCEIKAIEFSSHIEDGSDELRYFIELVSISTTREIGEEIVQEIQREDCIIRIFNNSTTREMGQLTSLYFDNNLGETNLVCTRRISASSQ